MALFEDSMSFTTATADGFRLTRVIQHARYGKMALAVNDETGEVAAYFNDAAIAEFGQVCLIHHPSNTSEQFMEQIRAW